MLGVLCLPRQGKWLIDMVLPKIGMLWVSGPLSYLEQLCVQSFLDAGHEVVFYHYGDVPNVPKGATMTDARTVLDGPPFLRHTRTGSLTLHSDLFRLRMLMQNDGMIWADTDAYCLRPWHPVDGHYYAYLTPGQVASGVLALPSDSATLKALDAFTRDPYPIPGWIRPRAQRRLQAAKDAGEPVHVKDMAWGTWGPEAVSYFLTQTGEVRHALPQEVLYPIGFAERGFMLRPARASVATLPEVATSVHFYGSRMRRMLTRRFNGIPPEGSLLDELVRRHNIDMDAAPIPAEAAPPETPAPEPTEQAIPAPKFIRPPVSDTPKVISVTCMKDEGAFIPEWIAYHQAIGVNHFIVYTNDCSDGSDRILSRLQEMGVVTHRDNTRRANERASYQLRGFRKAVKEQVFKQHDWVLVSDVDEYLNLHHGRHTIADLLAHVPEADVFSFNWRLFGHGGIDAFTADPMLPRFDRAAPLHCPVPAQAWGVKSLFRAAAVERIGPHRPIIPAGGDWEGINWVNGSGRPMPAHMQELTRGNWRTGPDGVGYELGQVNHYAVRSRQSFLIKFLKGTVHGGMDRSLGYWLRMDRNEEQDTSIRRMVPAMEKNLAELMNDDKLAQLHGEAVQWHQAQIDEALKHPSIAEMYERLGTEKMDLGE